MSNKEKSSSKLQWFFLVILIPIIFTIILCSVVLSLLGFNVIDKTKEFASSLPFVSSVMSEEDQADQPDALLLEQKLEEQNIELNKLQLEVERKDEEIVKLTFEKGELEQGRLIDGELATRAKKELESIAKTYEAMSAKNAALIISALPIEEALIHISEVSIEVRAGILAKMDSEKAADIMSRLANK